MNSLLSLSWHKISRNLSPPPQVWEHWWIKIHEEKTNLKRVDRFYYYVVCVIFKATIKKKREYIKLNFSMCFFHDYQNQDYQLSEYLKLYKICKVPSKQIISPFCRPEASDYLNIWERVAQSQKAMTRIIVLCTYISNSFHQHCPTFDIYLKVNFFFRRNFFLSSSKHVEIYELHLWSDISTYGLNIITMLKF